MAHFRKWHTFSEGNTNDFDLQFVYLFPTMMKRNVSHPFCPLIPNYPFYLLPMTFWNILCLALQRTIYAVSRKIYCSRVSVSCNCYSNMQYSTHKSFITTNTKAQQSYETDRSSATHFKWKHINREIWDFYEVKL